jgi:hypothetical protein
MHAFLHRTIFAALIAPVAFGGPILSFSFSGHVSSIVNPSGVASPIQIGDTATYTLYADYSSVYDLGGISGVPNPEPPGFYTEYYQSGPSDGVTVTVNTQSGPVVFSTVGIFPAQWDVVTRLFANGYPCGGGNVCPEQAILFESFYDPNVPANFPGIAGDLFDTDLSLLDLAAPFNLLSGAGFPSDLNLSAVTSSSGANVDIYNAQLTQRQYYFIIQPDNIPQTTPEPASGVLLAGGALLIAWRRRHRR